MEKQEKSHKETELSESKLEISSKIPLLSSSKPLYSDYILVFRNPQYTKALCPVINSFRPTNLNKKSLFSSLFSIKEDENLILKEALDKISKLEASNSLNEKDFNLIALDTVIRLIQEHLGLEVKLMLSADKDEVFAFIDAREVNLVIQGDLNDYKLQLSKEFLGISDLNELPKYQQVLPYAPLEKDLYEKDPFSYSKYNYQGEIDPQGSLFKYPDRVRLIKSMLCDTFSLTDMYRNNILSKEFPVHKGKSLLELQQSWANFAVILKPQPLAKIKDYFGEEIAFYFSFLELYLRYLYLFSIIGVIFFILIISNGDIISNSDYISSCLLTFSVIQGISCTIFQQLWTRKENFLAWKWGVTSFSMLSEQRQDFKGEKKVDEVSGKYKRIYSAKGIEKYSKVVGYGFIFFCVLLVGAALIAVFLFKNKYHWGVYVAGVLNGVQIKIFNHIYSWLARKLTDWENLETNREYFDSLTFKLFCFEFVNSYGSLLYIAFLKGDIETCYNDSCIEELRFQLIGIFFFNFFTNLLEVGIPYVKHKSLLANERRRATTVNSIMNEMEKEAVLTEYHSALYEYMEIIIDYGYMILFSSVFPLLPLFVLCSVLVEIRIDAWKLCFVTRRPFPTQSNTIGIWNQVMVWVSVIGLITNLAIVVFTHKAFGLSSAGDRWVLFLFIEHSLLLVKFVISLIIPDMPVPVKQGGIWGERIVKEKVLHAKVDDGKMKSILAARTVDPEKLLEANKVFELA